jgi:hypothetical protein
LTLSANLRHASGENRSTEPVPACLVSRMSTRPDCPTSMQLPPLLLLYVDFRHLFWFIALS